MNASNTILLAFPPHCDTALQGPHLGIPLLSGYLRQEGHSVKSLDLNIAFFRHVTRPDEIKNTIIDLQRRRDVLDAKESLDQKELDELLTLCKIDRFTERLSEYELEAQLDDTDFSLAVRLLAPQLCAAPLRFPANPSIVDAYYDQLDLGRMVEGVSMIGLGVAFYMQLHPALELAKRIKGLSETSPPIVIGGSQISLLTEEQKRALAKLPYIDAVIAHEGEAPLSEICTQVRDGRRLNFAKVPNAYFCKGEDVHKTAWRQPPPMSKLPCPVFNENELKLYAKPRVLPVYVSKGCYWGNCKFCDYTKLYTPGQAKTTFRQVDKVIDDIETLQSRFGIIFFWLVSECIPPSYYAKLSKKILSRALDVRLASYCRVEKSFNATFFQLLYKAGVHHLTFGVEATEDRILVLINKGNTVDDIRRTIRYASAAGIHVEVNLIPDYPTISWKEVQRSIGFIRENIDFIGKLNFQFFDLSSNSIIAGEENAHGLCVSNHRPVLTRHGFHSLSFTRKGGLSPEQMRRTREAFTCLSGDIEVYRRSKNLLNLIESQSFNWGKASFVLASDLDVAKLHFDPSKPDRRESHTKYLRLDTPVIVLSFPASRSRLTATLVAQSILDTADALGVFLLNDVIQHMASDWDIKNPHDYKPLVERCLRSMVACGLVKHIMHPWIDSSPSTYLPETLDCGLREQNCGSR